MGLWYWPDSHWVRVPLYRDRHDGKALICGTGPSLATAPQPADRLRISLNFAFLKVEPHIAVAMDFPVLLGDMVHRPFMKVFRGNYGDELVDNKAAKLYPNTFFADTDMNNRPHEAMFDHASDTTMFIWTKTTLAVAVHLALWLGYRNLGFIGVDLYNDLVPGQVSSSTDQTLECEYQWMRWFAKEAKCHGITLGTYSPNSRLTTVMPLLEA
jgi:hypothetical protein